MRKSIIVLAMINIILLSGCMEKDLPESSALSSGAESVTGSVASEINSSAIYETTHKSEPSSSSDRSSHISSGKSGEEPAVPHAVPGVSGNGTRTSSGNVSAVTSDRNNSAATLTSTVTTSSASTSPPQKTISLALPDKTTVYSPKFAMTLLNVCTGEEVREINDAGFTILTRRNYNKSKDDTSHTCAYTIAKGNVLRGGKYRTVFIVAVRGTVAGEWYSNFDIAPSHSDDTIYAENFMNAAEDVLKTLLSYAEKEEDPVFILCGHSRGAACSNLLGVLLNRRYPVNDTYVYTFATPATVHKEQEDTPTDNIFNIINPADVVPMLPLTAWGFHRAGTDIYLPGNADKKAKLEEFITAIGNLGHDIPSYYNDRHALFKAGLDPENGVTGYEFMLVLADLLAESNQYGGTLAKLAASGVLSTDSDFAPIFSFLGSISTDGGLQSIKTLFDGHAPSVYASLLEIAY